MRSASPLNPCTVHSEPPPLYDYAFVGSGASATLVLLALERRGLLAGKRVVVLDPDGNLAGMARAAAGVLQPKLVLDAAG